MDNFDSSQKSREFIQMISNLGEIAHQFHHSHNQNLVGKIFVSSKALMKFFIKPNLT